MNLIWFSVIQAVTLIAGIQWVDARTDPKDSKDSGNYERSLTQREAFRRALFGKSSTVTKYSRRKKRGMPIKDGPQHRRWPGGVVYYQIDSNDFTPVEKSKIRAAMDDYEKFSCLKFKNQKNTNMIQLRTGKGCRSSIGMVGGVQPLELGPNCRYQLKATAMHEIGHAIGLIHEHNRPDRDQHVTIIEDNIKDMKKDQFEKFRWDQVENVNTAYDHEGIMQYNGYGFSKNGKKTIALKNSQLIVGPTAMDDFINFSFSDVKAVNLMYRCHKNCKDITPELCPDGLVGKDCKCWCKAKLNGVEYDECDIELNF